MNKLYALTAHFLIISVIGAMDRPGNVPAAAGKPMTQAERTKVIEWAQRYVRDNNPSFLQNLTDHITEHKKLHFGVAALPSLTPEQEKNLDKVTVDKFGRFNLTERECIDMGIEDDPRIREMSEKDPFTVFSRKLEKAGASDDLIAQVMLAREQELKNNPQKDPGAQISHPVYNTWMRQIEDNSKISEEAFDQSLSQLCTLKAFGKPIELSFDANGDLITTRVFLYNTLPKEEGMRAIVGNLDHGRLSALQTMTQELQLDFNIPRKDGQLPLQVALAHGRFQAASILVAGAFGDQAFARGPVNLKLTPEQQAKNPLLLTLADSLRKSLDAYAYSKDADGKVTIDHAAKRYLETEVLLLAYYMLANGLSSELPAGLSDPIDYAYKNGFKRIGSLISLARNGQLKSRAELSKDSPALELVAKAIADASKKTAQEHIEPYRLI